MSAIPAERQKNKEINKMEIRLKDVKVDNADEIRELQKQIEVLQKRIEALK